MTDNVVKFPKKKNSLQGYGSIPKELWERTYEIERKKTLARLIHAKYAIVSVMNADDTITVIGIGDTDLPKGISLCAASIDAMAKDIELI